ncbi:MAG TPA: hypothetical protein VG738_04880 [Chitinophagaceae bacterium]|nr:hypothetical protein [Chitinophagaceae bacterium]
MRLFLFIILLSLTPIQYLRARQSDSTLIRILLQQIDSAQYKQNDGEFYTGMFKGYRACGGGPHNYQPDNNIFFTAVTAFGLRNMIPYLEGSNKRLAETIYQRASTSYPLFKNRYGNPYYGFWATNDIIMPHTFIFQYLKQVFGQGEDADDTVMILMSSDTDDSTAKVLKNRMVAVSNLAKGRRIISTYKKYRDIPAYSTWLGDRMAPDFDFAVHCNILYFMLSNKLPLVQQDSATIQLLAEMVRNREYMKDPIFLSPYYVHSSILLYHLTRLMGAFKIPELEPYKPQLVEDIHSLLGTCHNVMDQIILRTSLLRLGATAPELDLHSINEFEASNQNSFVFFQARAAFPYPEPLKKIFLHWSYIYYYFYCPAYNKMLWLEYLVEKNKAKHS